MDFGGGPLTSAGDYDIFLAKFDAAGNHLWSERFGDAVQQWGNSVAVDGAGNVFVTGFFEGSADFGGGPLTSAGASDIFLAKFEGSGRPTSTPTSTPTATLTATPTSMPAPVEVGGVADVYTRDGAGSSAAGAGGGSGEDPAMAISLAMAAALAMAGGGWYVRRRRRAG